MSQDSRARARSCPCWCRCRPSAPYTYAVPDGMSVAPGLDRARAARHARRWSASSGTAPARAVDAEEAAADRRMSSTARRSTSAMRRFVDWVADYTLSPPRHGAAHGAARAGGLRSGAADRRACAGRAPSRSGMTPARRRVLELAADGLAWSRSGLAHAAGVVVRRGRRAAWRRALFETGDDAAARRSSPRPTRTMRSPTLIAGAGEAARSSARAVGDGGFSVTLLDGVTGSGKTEVYFEAVAAALEAGRQVLVLLPEIALTGAFLERFAATASARGRPNGIPTWRRACASGSGGGGRGARCGSSSARARRCSCPSPSSA